MTTTTRLDKEMPVTGPPVHPLQAKSARNSLGDTLRSMPRKARAWFASTMRTFHLDGAAASAASGLNWLYQRVRRAGRFVRGIGLLNLATTVITWRKAREVAVAVAARAYRIVRKPIEWIGRGLSWLFGKIGFTSGQKALDRVAKRVEKVENWVAGKVAQAGDWMNKREAHPVMRATRALALGVTGFRLARRVFPDAPTWAALGVASAMPAIGDQAYKEAVIAEEAAIVKAHQTLDKKQPVRGPEDPKGRPTSKQVHAKVEQSKIELKTVVLLDSRIDKTDPKRFFEAPAFIGLNGEQRIYLGSQLLHEEDLPDFVTVVGEHLGEVGELVQDHEKRNAATAAKIEAEVRAAQSSSTGRPPTLPRAAARAEARGAGKAKAKG